MFLHTHASRNRAQPKYVGTHLLKKHVTHQFFRKLNLYIRPTVTNLPRYSKYMFVNNVQVIPYMHIDQMWHQLFHRSGEHIHEGRHVSNSTALDALWPLQIHEPRPYKQKQLYYYFTAYTSCKFATRKPPVISLRIRCRKS